MENKYYTRLHILEILSKNKYFKNKFHINTLAHARTRTHKINIQNKKPKRMDINLNIN
jgi:hypothetical protein